MKTKETMTTVCGKSFAVYSDFIARGTFARNEETGETKCIRSSGYISNDLSIRKAIALVFGMNSFRK